MFKRFRRSRHGHSHVAIGVRAVATAQALPAIIALMRDASVPLLVSRLIRFLGFVSGITGATIGQGIFGAVLCASALVAFIICLELPPRGSVPIPLWR